MLISFGTLNSNVRDYTMNLRGCSLPMKTLFLFQYFIIVKYPNGVACPHYGITTNVYCWQNKNFKVFECAQCHNSFSVLTGIIFECTRVELRKWFYAMNQMITDKKGRSAKQLQRQIGESYETSCRMLKLD